jgi:hypothetical protein
MKVKWLSIVLIGLVLLLAYAGQGQAQPVTPVERVDTQIKGGAGPDQLMSGTGPGPADGSFTYQGEIKKSGAPINGTCDFQFGVWDRAVAGAQIDSTQTILAQSVTDGRFTVLLNSSGEFAYSFRGQARWLQIAVRCPAGSGSYTTLSPRQPLTSVPYATSLIQGAVLYNQSAGGAGSWTPGLWVESDSGLGVLGRSHNAAAAGVVGENDANGIGVSGGSGWIGVKGQASGSANAVGVAGVANGGGCTTGTTGCMGVQGTSESGYAIWGQSATGIGVYGSSDSTGVAIKAESSGTGNLIEAWRGPALADRKFYVSNAGNVYADGAFTGGGADVAERIETKEVLQPGDVVEIDPDHAGAFRLSRSPYSTLVAGVISTNPGLTMNNDQDGDPRPALALVGQAPVKVSAENGSIHPGDLLVAAATPGYAMKAGANPAIGTVIGKAVGVLESGKGVIPMLIMLR